MYPAATHLFRALPSSVDDVAELAQLKTILHTYVNKLFGLEGDSVDDARLKGIVFSGKDFTNIPPSSDALNQKLLRTALQVCRHIFIKYS